jgi:hypothetical protein
MIILIKQRGRDNYRSFRGYKYVLANDKLYSVEAVLDEGIYARRASWFIRALFATGLLHNQAARV